MLPAAALLALAAAAPLEAAAASSEAVEQHVDVLTVLCGAAAAESASAMLDSLVFHRSVPLRLHIVADRAARRALPTPRPPRTAGGGTVEAVQTSYMDAEQSLSALQGLADAPTECAALPLFAADLLPAVHRVVVLAPEVVVLTDIAALWQHFAPLEARGALLGAVTEQSSWYTDLPGWAGAQADSVNGAVLLFDLAAMRAADWAGLVAQARAIGRKHRQFGDRDLQDTLNALRAVDAFQAAHELHQLPCQWNVQLTEGASLCSRTSGKGDTGCRCLPPKLLYDDPTANTAGHSLRSTYDFWAQSGKSLSKEYLFHPQPLVLRAPTTTAAVGVGLDEDDEDCAQGWTGEDCDECAPGYSGDLCDQRRDGISDNQSTNNDDCAAGWSGEYCDHRVADDTACAEGWAGEYCNECAPGFSGDLCDQRAPAAASAAATADDEACSEGWAGEDCDECAPGFSGDLCDQRAPAAASAAATADDEACSEGWAGEDCDECAPGYGGETCAPVVQLPPRDACARGWTGQFCNECASGLSGDMCVSSSAELHSKWARYRDKHFSAVATFQPCAGVACYNLTLLTDLEPFGQPRSVLRSTFEHARTHNMERTQGKGRMNHYQIIGGKLYRSERCPSLSGRLSFHPRCEGIEGTLLQILDEDNLASMSRRKKKLTGPPIPDTCVPRCLHG
jgi:hypothetical protein